MLKLRAKLDPFGGALRAAPSSLTSYFKVRLLPCTWSPFIQTLTNLPPNLIMDRVSGLRLSGHYLQTCPWTAYLTFQLALRHTPQLWSCPAVAGLCLTLAIVPSPLQPELPCSFHLESRARSLLVRLPSPATFLHFLPSRSCFESQTHVKQSASL